LKKRAARDGQTRDRAAFSLLSLPFMPNCGRLLWRYENITRIPPLLLLLLLLLLGCCCFSCRCFSFEQVTSREITSGIIPRRD
jgi:hypothetical protein